MHATQSDHGSDSLTNDRQSQPTCIGIWLVRWYNTESGKLIVGGYGSNSLQKDNEMRTILCFCVIIGVGSACANPVNLHTARKYADAGYRNISAGDWVEAQKNFGKALVNARLGKADDRSLAVVLYEYGRASGVLCDWEESAAALNDAYNLDRESDGPTHMSLFELARMYVSQRKFSKAVEYYERVLPEFDRLQADARDPIAYAEFLEEYSSALEQTGRGKAGHIRRLRARAQELRNTFPNAEAVTEKTPYGTHCNKE